MSDITISEAERVVISGLAEGKSYKQIAHDLGTTYFSVQRRSMDAMERLGLRTAAGLVALALRKGWIE